MCLQKFKRIKLENYVNQAIKDSTDKIIFLSYGGTVSMSADIANLLCHKFPQRYIVVGFTKEAITNLSLRGKNVRKILEEVLKEFPNASGGGHEDAVCARVRTLDLNQFREAIE